MEGSASDSSGLIEKVWDVSAFSHQRHFSPRGFSLCNLSPAGLILPRLSTESKGDIISWLHIIHLSFCRSLFLKKTLKYIFITIILQQISFFWTISVSQTCQMKALRRIYLLKRLIPHRGRVPRVYSLILFLIKGAAGQKLLLSTLSVDNNCFLDPQKSNFDWRAPWDELLLWLSMTFILTLYTIWFELCLSPHNADAQFNRVWRG